MTPPVASLELTDRIISPIFGIQNVVDVLRGLNGTRKIVLSGIKDALGEGECLKHMSFSYPQTTITDVVKDDHPLMPCKNCKAYELTDYDCPHYRSTALYTLRKGVNDHLTRHPEDSIIPIVTIIQERLPDSYKI